MQLKQRFDDILFPLGNNSAEFFMVASLYHARKISFARAASLAELNFDEFLYRLEENFGKGFMIDDNSILEDIELVEKI